MGEHRRHQARQQQRIAPLRWNVEVDSGHSLFPEPIIPCQSRRRIAGRRAAWDPAHFMREQIEFPDIDLWREQERANSAAKEFIGQRAQLTTRVIQQFARLRVVPRQDDSVALHCEYQRRMQREHHTKLVLRGRQNFHQARMISLVEAGCAHQHAELAQETDGCCVTARYRRTSWGHTCAGNFLAQGSNWRCVYDRYCLGRWRLRVSDDFHSCHGSFFLNGAMIRVRLDFQISCCTQR